MAEQSFPFENIDTTESQFSEWATNFQETGVQGSPTGTELGITVTGSDLNLTVASGQAFIRGHYYINTSDLVIAVPTAGVNTRIDIVVVELDPEANTIVTKIVLGEAVSADPVAPTLTQSATGIYQLPIATLTIPTSTVAITAGMLVDTRTFMGNRIGIWTTATRPANPTNYQTLGYNTTIGSHESWNGTAWVGFFDPISTEGDLVVGDGTGQASRLGIGADDQVLTVVSGVPAWADGGAGGNYYNITAGGTYTVDLAAGLYSVASTGEVTVGGVSVDGNLGLVNYASDITSIVAPEVGTTWTTRTSGFGSNDINAVTYGAGLYLAGGDNGTMATSPDGTNWTIQTSGFGSSNIGSLTHGDGLYLAAGGDGKLSTSTNATSWTSQSAGFGSGFISSLTFGDGLYVAAQGSNLRTSPDGVTWTARTANVAIQINVLTFGDGLYVAAGYGGGLSTSPDGITWTAQTSNVGGSVYGLTYGDGLYVAAGQDGALSTSPDGSTWTSRTSGFEPDGHWIQNLAYGAGVYVAVGDNRRISTSPDGITWTAQTSGFVGYRIYVVSFGNGLFIAASNGGEMVTSSEFQSCFLTLDPKTPLTTLS